MFYKSFIRFYLLTISLSISSTLMAFEWRLNDLWVCGDTPFSSCDDFPTLDPFFDDFEDGDRSSAPTSSLIDFTGSSVTESGGYLVFDASEGGMEVDLGGQTIPYIRNEVFVNTLIPDNTADGFTVFAAQFDSDLTQFVSSGIDETTLVANDTSSGFGITFAGYRDGTGATGYVGAQLGVFNSYLGCQTIYFNDLNPHWAEYVNPVTGESQPLDNYGYDVIGGGSGCTDKIITGDIILRFELIQDTENNPVLSGNNLLRPSYSIDGGATFITYDQWDSATAYGSSYLVPISYRSSPPGEEPVVYDGAAASVFGQTATAQLLEEEFVPIPFWALVSLAVLFSSFYKFNRKNKTYIKQ